jgi:hypothetical protein
MASTFDFWDDSGMTQSHSGTISTVNGGDFVIYLGSNNASRKLEAQSNPGVDDILITPTDSNPGNNHEASEIKLANTLLGLDSAVAGQALNLGTQVSGGSAQPIYIRLTDGTGGGIASTELSLALTDCWELSI